MEASVSSIALWLVKDAQAWSLRPYCFMWQNVGSYYTFVCVSSMLQAYILFGVIHSVRLYSVSFHLYCFIQLQSSAVDAFIAFKIRFALKDMGCNFDRAIKGCSRRLLCYLRCTCIFFCSWCPWAAAHHKQVLCHSDETFMLRLWHLLTRRETWPLIRCLLQCWL